MRVKRSSEMRASHFEMYQELYNSQLETFKVSFLTAAARGGRIDEVASLIDFAAGGEDNLENIIRVQATFKSLCNYHHYCFTLKMN